MTHLAVVGWGVLCSGGIGSGALAALAARHDSDDLDPGVDVANLYPDALPSQRAHALVDFDVRRLLGRKGTAFLDRRSALALVACKEALEDSQLRIDDGNRHRIGVVVGTTWGSLKAMSDYTKESLLEDRPYLVNAALFPNTVMNCAAGQTAIRFGLKGVNATVAGGQMALLNALIYAANALRGGHADSILACAVEEFTPHNAWATYLAQPGSSPATAGEGAAAFVLQRIGDVKKSDQHLDAEVLSISSEFSPGGEAAARMPTALADCIRRVLAKANVRPADVSTVATCETGDACRDEIELIAVSAVFGSLEPDRIRVNRSFGECLAATGGLQLAMLLSLHRDDHRRDGNISLLTGWTRDGGIGAAIVRGWGRVGSHRG